MKINIVTHYNGVGLQRDAEIIRSILAPKHEIVISEHGKPIAETADLHIFLEVPLRAETVTGKKILIPNPEWYRTEWRTQLKKFDAVLCKTFHSVEIFSKLHKNAIYTGFTSVDRMDESVERRSDFLAHFPGKSKMKGTTEIKKFDKVRLKVFSDYGNFLPTELFTQMFNSYSVHLCPSNAEGWGHYIWEAFSVGAFVITTDAAPMNEPEFVGAKVKAKRCRPHGLAPTWKVDIHELELAIAGISPEQITSARWVNRALFLRNDSEFRARFSQVIDQL